MMQRRICEKSDGIVKKQAKLKVGEHIEVKISVASECIVCLNIVLTSPHSQPSD
jgi:hypothetical protein